MSTIASEESPVWKYVQDQLRLLVLDKVEIHLYNGETSIETEMEMESNENLTTSCRFENKNSNLAFNSMFKNLSINPPWSGKKGVRIRIRSMDNDGWDKHLAAIEKYFAPVVADLVDKKYCLVKAADCASQITTLKARRKRLLELSRGY